VPKTNSTIFRWGYIYAIPGLVAIVFVMALLFGKSGAEPNNIKPNSRKPVDSIKLITPTTGLNSKTPNSNSNITPTYSKTEATLPAVHQGLSESSDPSLKQLAVYEQSAGGALAGGMMIFTETPTTISNAQSSARDTANRIANFAKYNLIPVIVMEPTNSGATLNFTSYRNGAYDTVLNTYFSTLKNIGVSDKNMGMWVYFPEANMPEWGPVDVANYAANVTKTIQIQKKYFPASLSSILLDAESYPAGSTDWSNGSYISLSPFISAIPRGLVDSFGLQGFPWAPPSNQRGDASYNSSIYLNSAIAADAASRLGTSSIWLNTGTFSTMYANNRSQIVNMGPSQRQALLNGVFAQASKLKQSGFGVSVNLFSEDKSRTSEAIDWSYKTAEEKNVLSNFALQLHQSDIELWLFSG
jgi:hypothetical protein